MKKYLVTILLSWLHIGAFCQSTQVTNYITEITNIIKSKSIVADQINWAEYDKEVGELSRNVNSIDSCKPILDHIIRILRKSGDKHSFFINKTGVEKLNSSTVLPTYARGEFIDGTTGYIKIPSMVSFNDQVNNAYRDSIQQLIKKLGSENGVLAWIVDLRGNTGGNMWPMLAGLNALIKDGLAGYWINAKGKKLKWYSYGHAFMGTGKFYKIKNLKVPIAVLIDTFTASSGEMTAISFLGLRNVKTFGLPSAGYTTANFTFRLSSGAILQLATSYAADRKKTIYKDRIYPDVEIKENTKTADDTIQAALEWLRTETWRCCI